MHSCEGTSPLGLKGQEKNFDLTRTKVFLTSPPFQRQLVDCLKEHDPSMRTPGAPPLWVVVHVMVKCMEDPYALWRRRLGNSPFHKLVSRCFSAKSEMK